MGPTQHGSKEGCEPSFSSLISRRRVGKLEEIGSLVEKKQREAWATAGRSVSVAAEKGHVVCDLPAVSLDYIQVPQWSRCKVSLRLLGVIGQVFCVYTVSSCKVRP